MSMVVKGTNVVDLNPKVTPVVDGKFKDVANINGTSARKLHKIW